VSADLSDAGLAGDEPPIYPINSQDAKGQEHVKRALEVAAAGSHNVLMGGPPGAGKTLFARAVPSILLRMTFDESLAVTKIYSISSQLPSDTPLIGHRPFRAPHHTISYAGLVGGGKVPGTRDHHAGSSPMTDSTSRGSLHPKAPPAVGARHRGRGV
jgi:magnesium chelatase family protein